MLLSRVAERIYWAARYMERAEDTARIVRTHGELLAASPLYTDLVGQWDAEPGDTEPTGAPWSRASERSSSAHCSSSRAD